MALAAARCALNIALALALFAGAASAAPSPGGFSEADLVEIVDQALRHAHGEGIRQDGPRSRRLLCLAALSGSARAEFELGWIAANGRGVTRDDAVAAGWFARAADGGEPHAARLARWFPPTLAIGDPACPLPEAGRVPERREIERWVEIIAPAFDLEPGLVKAVIAVESSYRVDAISPKGAMGLMQLMPATAHRFDVGDPFDPLQNLYGGIRYLRWLHDHFDWDPTLAIAGYNAGEGAVGRYDGVPPYRETQNYLRKVVRLSAPCGEARDGV